MFETSLLIYVIVSFVSVVHCQTHEDSFTLELKELFPCQETELRTNVSLHKSDILAVQANLTLCSNDTSWNINQFNVSHNYDNNLCTLRCQNACTNARLPHTQMIIASCSVTV